MAVTSGGGSSAPTSPTAPAPFDPRDLAGLEVPIGQVWAKIEAMIQAKIDDAIAALIRTSGQLDTIACTVGTPGVPLVATPTVPWATIAVPYPAIFERYEYFGAGGHPCQIDVRIVRPGQSVGDGSSAIPGGPPTFDVDIARFLAGPGAGSYIEPNSALSFYVDSTDGVVECVTCNVIVRRL